MSGRDDLLEAIKQGKKLRKTVTNDRSAPNVGGSVVGSSSTLSTSSTLPKRASGVGGGFPSSNNSNPSHNHENPPPQQRLPGIGGLFADGMPKLKSTANTNHHTGYHQSHGTYRRGELTSKFGSNSSTSSAHPPPPSSTGTNPFSKEPLPRKPTAPLSIPKKCEAPPPPPPPLAHKPSFPNRTRSFNTGQIHPPFPPAQSASSNSNRNMTSSNSKDDSSVLNSGSSRSLGPSRRPMKPPNHPPPPPPIPKRLSTHMNSTGGSLGRSNNSSGVEKSLQESFEMRFAGLFKPMSLFPPPEPFTCIQKTYPSKNQARKAVSRS